MSGRQSASDDAGHDASNSGKGKAPAGDGPSEDQSSLLTCPYPYCYTCQSFVNNPFACIEDRHIMNRDMDGSNDGLMLYQPQYHWNEGSKGSFELSATGSGYCFSSWENTHATTNSLSFPVDNFGFIGQTQGLNSYASSPQIPDQATSIEHSFTAVNSPQLTTAPGESSSSSSLRPLHAAESQSSQGSISPDNQDVLQFWKSHWARTGKVPNDDDLRALVQLTNLDLDYLRHWFFGSIPPTGKQPEDAEITAEMQRDVADFARQRHGRPCENPQSKKASPDQKYKCTFGCPYSTHDWDTWRRHLRNKYPQAFWICKLCHQVGRSPCIWHRKDKMDDHMKAVHPQYQKEQRKKQCEQSRVEYQADFPTQCPFQGSQGPCLTPIRSWDEYIKHCKYHFDSDASKGLWHLPRNDRPPPEDDYDHTGPDHSTQGSQASGNYLTSGWNHVSQNWDRTGSSSQSNGRSRNADPASLTQDLSESVEDEDLVKKLYQKQDFVRLDHDAPLALIDVDQRTMVAGSMEFKYLALDYSRAIQGLSKYVGPLTTLFANAIALTRDMGYRYLWIDQLCRTSADLDRTILYKNALLTIFMVKFDEVNGRIWHFTCHYKNFGNVSKWTESGVHPLSCSHVRMLGHGAYGIVDEVRLSVEPQPFARKMYMRWKRADNEGSMPVQELEMLQKLEHDSIPKFIAAYISNSSLNILMLPVAECNLKELLAQPHRWPGRRQHITSWFLPLISALSYMHSLSCRHKDIKPANILVKDCHVYLSDFGTSSEFSFLSGSKSWGGSVMTPKYCAPEVARRGSRGRKADVFSLGCVFVEMLTVALNLSIKELDKHLGFTKTCDKRSPIYSCHIKDLKAWLKRLKALASSSFHRVVIDLSKRMLDFDPAKRPTAQEVFDRLRGASATFDLWQAGQQAAQLLSLHKGNLQLCSQSPPKSACGLPNQKLMYQSLTGTNVMGFTLPDTTASLESTLGSEWSISAFRTGPMPDELRTTVSSIDVGFDFDPVLSEPSWRDHILGWCDVSDSGTIFWISGKPSAGKSTLARILTEQRRLGAKSEDSPCAHRMNDSWAVRNMHCARCKQGRRPTSTKHSAELSTNWRMQPVTYFSYYKEKQTSKDRTRYPGIVCSSGGYGTMVHVRSSNSEKLRSIADTTCSSLNFVVRGAEKGVLNDSEEPARQCVQRRDGKTMSQTVVAVVLSGGSKNKSLPWMTTEHPNVGTASEPYTHGDSTVHKHAQTSLTHSHDTPESLSESQFVDTELLDYQDETNNTDEETLDYLWLNPRPLVEANQRASRGSITQTYEIHMKTKIVIIAVEMPELVLLEKLQTSQNGNASRRFRFNLFGHWGPGKQDQIL